MNGVKNELHVRVEQTARGIWYSSGVDVYGENPIDLEIELDRVMKSVEKILDQHNAPSEEEKQHTDLTTADTFPPHGKKVAK